MWADTQTVIFAWVVTRTHTLSFVSIMHFWDTQGLRYMDWSNWVLHIGLRHPMVLSWHVKSRNPLWLGIKALILNYNFPCFHRFKPEAELLIFCYYSFTWHFINRLWLCLTLPIPSYSLWFSGLHCSSQLVKFTIWGKITST